MKRQVNAIERTDCKGVILRTNSFLGKNAKKTCQRFIKQSSLPYVLVDRCYKMINGEMAERYFAELVIRL